MTTQDVNVVLMDFPNNQREMVVSNEDGTYTILINAKLSHDSQLRAYSHALKHINDADFEKSNVQTIENQAHQITVPATAEIIPSDIFREKLLKLRRDRRRIKRELEKKEQEIARLIELHGQDWLFNAAEERWLRES